jgi:hypothetical protein
MKRDKTALVVATALGSSFFGIGALIALPLMLVLGVPLFLLCQRHRLLQWWHAALCGLLCGALGSLLIAPANLAYLDSFGIQNGLIFTGIGIFTGLLFWWLGIFRNDAYPYVSASVPYSMLLVVPIALAGFQIHRSLGEVVFAKGRIIEVQGEPPTRQVSVRLSDGTIVHTTLRNDSRPTSVMLNQCWHLMNNWSVRDWGRGYSLSAPFGGGVNEC